MDEDKLAEAMLESIKISERSVSEDLGVHPKVGAVLTDSRGNIILNSYRGESGNGDHCEYILLKKAKEQGINLSDKILFVTLEPCTSRGSGKVPCAQRIAESGISKVYIGMLDPNPIICGRGETLLRPYTTVERFPANLVKMIENINKEFVEYYRPELLPDTSLYVTKQIPDLMLENLQRAGLLITDLPTDWDIDIFDVVHHASLVVEGDKETIKKLVLAARREAYDKKYCEYTYENDARGVNNNWHNEVNEVFSLLNIEDINKYSVVNVGAGNGLEAKDLFPRVQKLMLVDIGKDSLKKANALLPHAIVFENEAENLKNIEMNTQDVYVSLRTYQSSYFDVKQALREAVRVLKPNGSIILSVANGFIGEGGVLIPGLVIPKSKLVDKNRPYEVVERIRRMLNLLGFNNVGIRTGLSEIYVYGRRY